MQAAKLLGRGGAAFPTGKKWAAVAAEPALPHFVVCNADESEPGTFKDRVLMTRRPVRRGRGDDHLRHRHPQRARLPLRPRRVSRRRSAQVAAAIGAARAAGLLGDDVAGSGHRFDIEVRRGAGAYICGEETALFNSLEGRRGEPRSKPPFPSQVGVFGQPTVVNNVETLANVPDILVARRRGVGGHRHRRLDRHPPVLPVGTRRPARAVRVCRSA